MIPSNSLVFLIDDDASVRRGVSRLLRSAGYKNEAFRSASDFLAREQHSGPACLIVDVRMPGAQRNGSAKRFDSAAPGRTTRLHHRARRHLDVCAGDESRRSRFSPEAVSRHRTPAMCRAALARSADQRRRSIEKAAARRLLDLLTPREFEVMQLVVTGMLNKQIASELGTAEKTIKVHRGRVMKKLGIVSVADLVRLVETAQIAFPRWRETKV